MANSNKIIKFKPFPNNLLQFPQNNDEGKNMEIRNIRKMLYQSKN